MLRKSVVVLCIGLAVAGCGSSPADRALSGAGIGGAGGAALGAVTGLGAIEGALIGGTAGAVAGAVTSRDQVDLGRPVWKRGWGNEGKRACRDERRRGWDDD